MLFLKGLSVRIRYAEKRKIGNLIQDVTKMKHVSMVKYFNAFSCEKNIY